MTAAALTALCLLCVAALLVAEFRAWPAARAVAKTLASLAFVGVALALDASASVHGGLIVAALGLSVLGDVLLLSDRSAAFLAGLGAFLAAHLVFAAAFLAGGVATPAAALAAVAAVPVGVAVLRWLGPTLGPSFRAPVVAYVAAILVMCALAVGHAAAGGHGLVVAGALLFAASDLAVAREKFVRPSPLNKTWGLPAYYLAQLLLAWSVA
jgi:uncharacterized membrane protein YhhN